MKKGIGNDRGQVKASSRKCHSSKTQCKLQNDPRRYQGEEQVDQQVQKLEGGGFLVYFGNTRKPVRLERSEKMGKW